MSKYKITAPKWILDRLGITQRQWKSKKRKELKQVIKSFDSYRMGCAYCPGADGEIGELQTILDKLKNMHSVKEWG